MIKSGQSVFRSSDLAILWKIQDRDYLKNKIYRLVKAGALQRLRPGLFAWSEDYDPMLAANKLIAPSYVSLQTILAQAGAIFQYDSYIYSIAQSSAEKKIASTRYVYRKIRDLVFFQRKGIHVVDNVTRASPERAFLDWFYLNPSAAVDNLTVFDWDSCLNLLPLYQNKALERRVQQCYKDNNMK
jgi:hypothetical protein